jgi:hypothetical protein
LGFVALQHRGSITDFEHGKDAQSRRIEARRANRRRKLQGESPSKTFGTSIQFSKCTTAAKIGNKEIALTTHFFTPVVIEYHNNHFVQIGSETLEEAGSVRLAGGKRTGHQR